MDWVCSNFRATFVIQTLFHHPAPSKITFAKWCSVFFFSLPFHFSLFPRNLKTALTHSFPGIFTVLPTHPLFPRNVKRFRPISTSCPRGLLALLLLFLGLLGITRTTGWFLWSVYLHALAHGLAPKTRKGGGHKTKPLSFSPKVECVDNQNYIYICDIIWKCVYIYRYMII